ncbi:hypothetical protein Tco_1509929 [Tanacetum coccineum]
MTSQVMSGDNDAIGRNDDEGEINNVVEEEDGEQIRFLGGNSFSGIKKYRGSNSSDGGNIRDGVKIVGEVIGSGDEIGSLRIHIEQRIAAMMGYRGGRGLEDDEERLLDELHELETSFDVLDGPCDAAA